ncbi:MAG TPA: ABC transporter ATP-binding protein [Myxococcota bacterium]
MSPAQAQDALHEEELLGKAYDARLMARLWRWVAPYRGQVIATLLLTAPMFVLELAPAWIVKSGLDYVQGQGAARGGLARLLEPPGGLDPLAWLAALYLAAMAASAGLQFVHAVLMSKTGQSAVRDLRRDVFAHLQRLHMGFFDRHPVGRLVTRATNDVENVSEMFSAGIVALVTDLLKMVGFAVVLFLVDARLAAVAFLVVPLLAVCAIVFRARIRRAFRQVRVRIARINATIQETITGIKVVQLFTREERNQRDFERLNAAHRDAWLDSIRYDAALFAAVEMANGLATAVIIGYGASLVIGGSLTLGTLYVFMDWMRRFFLPLRDLSAKYSVMQSAMASCERIFQLLDTEPAVRDPVAAPPARPAPRARPGEVVFEHVWFAYQGEDWVLRDFSLRVRPGERVALVGATGAGKTSVIKLLIRLYEPTRGRILLDGVDLREIPQRELRARIATVLQDVFLFSGTVASNIALGRRDLDRAAVERAARTVEADRFIARLPRGYDTELRERGSDLSAGQRQLLSFARAVAHGGDLLVLDEATSSVDLETEALVQRGLHALLAQRTAIVIAHRLSTIQDVDTIHVLHRGRLVESGSHAELLARRGAYWRLYRLQFEHAGEPAAREAAAASPVGA